MPHDDNQDDVPVETPDFIQDQESHGDDDVTLPDFVTENTEEVLPWEEAADHQEEAEAEHQDDVVIPPSFFDDETLPWEQIDDTSNANNT